MDGSLRMRKKTDTPDESLWRRRFDRLELVEKIFLERLSSAEKDEDTKRIATASLNLAALYFLNSMTDKSLPYLNRSLKWFGERKKEKGYVRAILLQGNISESFGDYETTLSLWLEALKIAREIGDKPSEAEACSQLGLVYFRLSNYARALEYFEYGLKIREDLNDRQGEASSLNRIGMVLRQTKKYKESLDYYFRSLEIRKKTKQKQAIPWTLLGIANTFEDSGEPDKALGYYRAGIEKSDERCMMQCLMGAGRIYSKSGKYDLAERFLSDALEKAKKLKSLYLIADSYNSLSQHYERTGQPALALENYKLFREARESLLSEESQSRLRNIEVAHAVEKSEQEKEIFRLKNVELKNAYDIIDEKNRDITSSINYAGRIQNALLPKVSEIRGLSGHIFILYLPRDIISGDFYWFTRAGNEIIIAAGDCTGHGVPGALMSMLGISFLDEIVDKQEILDPARILDELSLKIRKALRQKGDFTDSKDGIDISVCRIDRKNLRMRYSGANNNLYHISSGQLIEIKADRMPAGYNETPDKRFTEYEIAPSKGDMIYLFSDGFADQFGGPNNKKYKYSRLKDTLISLNKLPLNQQKKQLEKEFCSWKGDNLQVDDVMIVGYRL